MIVNSHYWIFLMLCLISADIGYLIVPAYLPYLYILDLSLLSLMLT